MSLYSLNSISPVGIEQAFGRTDTGTHHAECTDRMDQEQYQKEFDEFDEQLWISMVDHMVVYSKEDIRVVYRDGIEK